MSKVLVEKAIGGDGAKASLVIEGGSLQAVVSYPIAGLVDGVVKQLDPLKAKLEALIPGDWENPLVDKAFAEIKDQLTKLLSE